MLKKVILTLYVIIIGIAIGVIVVSMNRNEQGLIQFGNTILVEVESNVLEPKLVIGDLVLVNSKEQKVKEKDIITYFALENQKSEIRTNEIAAITEDVNGVTIYSLKKEDGTIENIDNSCIIGTYKLSIPYAGTILNYILSKDGFLTVTLVPAIILFLIMLLKFVMEVIPKKQI